MLRKNPVHLQAQYKLLISASVRLVAKWLGHLQLVLEVLGLITVRKSLVSEHKEKEALSNVAYNVTDNISSRPILRHNNYIFNRYLPALLYLPSTSPFMRASAKALLVPKVFFIWPCQCALPRVKPLCV